MSQTTYHPYIDGLRAVAIAPVILFHLGMDWIPGGYLGVDVFFVISGFLITSILLREMTAGTFSFKQFWVRRIRRIFPALLVVTVGTLAATWAFVFPSDRPAIGRQAIATLLSVANFYFWRHANNYWGPQAEESPFLHAWSLAVEEHFYLLFPLFVYAIHRWNPLRLAVGLAAIIAASFGLFLFGVHARPSATFYLLPTRAWELATGGLLATILHSSQIGKTPFPGAASAAATGLFAILASYVLVPELSGWTVVPVLGAATVIGCGMNGWTNRFLSQPVIVFIGKLSYSLYLYHWPVIVLSRHLFCEVPAFLLVLITTGLAVASYYGVEEPVRRRQGAIPRIACVFTGALLAAFLLSKLPAPPYDVSRFDRPQTFSRFYDIAPPREENAEWSEIFATMDAPAPIASPEAYREDGIIVGPGAAPPSVVVLGDSHGTMWAHVIRTVAEEAGRTVAFYCMGGESPFIEFPLEKGRHSRKLSATEKYEYDLARIRNIERWKPDVVIICARWSTVKAGIPEQLMFFLQEHAKRVVLIEQPPELAGVGNRSVAAVAAFRGIRPKPGIAQFWAAGNLEAYEAGRKLLHYTATLYPNCEVLPTRDLFAEGSRVCFLNGAELLYVDDDHLTTQGSLLALDRMRKVALQWNNSSTSVGPQSE